MSVWVVGGTSGIGKAVVQRLISEHFDVTVHTTGSGIDVRDQNLLDLYASQRSIDKIVYSAGVNHLAWTEDIQTEEMANLYDINVLGLIRVLRAVPSATDVVVIGSDAAWRPMRTSVAYCPSKAALHMAVQVIARERAGSGFRINVVAPGKVEGTRMTAYTDKTSAELRPDMDHIEYQLGQIPSRRFCTPDEVAEVVCGVLLTETDYLNGAIIPVNGGRV